MVYKASRKEEVADEILKWVEKNEASGTLEISGELDIAVLAATINRMG